MEQVTVHGCGHAEDTDQGGDDDLDYLERSHIDQQHGRIHAEDIGHHKSADGQLGGVDAGFHGVGLGNGGTGVGG